MTTSNSGLVFLALGILLLVCLNSALSARKERKKCPPGPPPKFLIGNLLDFPGKRLGQTYLEHGRQIGSDIVHVSALGNHVIVLNTREVAEELLEKRARNSSGRPWFAMTKMLDWEYNVAAMDYGEEWRKHRKVCQQHFNRVAAKSFQSVQLQKTRRLLVGLLRSPEKFMLHNRM
ncbi:hypothetical protein NLJ89_g11331 [Agrocybe chaxingu]|uniref:Uncharacterized protein n=1 Tax=Agrocybe chaxingu TaxID=84603 RepID=A0A9W8JPK2_9AGAR|nr:hypothetical protein NLJ89_g11331 [Agrocybe chaxingu]